MINSNTFLGENILFSNYEILPKIKICVVIPVKNEEKYIFTTLNAFLNQVDDHGKKLDAGNFEILILANNCTDGSVKLIREFQHKNPELNILLEEIELQPHQANIGYVRRVLMESAYSRLSKNKGGIILTTDADTTVSNNWIIQNLNEIEKGADAVGGRILLSPKEIFDLDADTFALHLKDEKYQLLVAQLEAVILNIPHDPLPRHHQHFNGSFAITSECYFKSGGIPEVTHLEDIALFERLNLIDAKVRHSNKVIVHTSARCVGRTEIGLSYQLNSWKNLGADGAHLMVESFDSINERFINKKRMADLWQKRNLAQSEFQLEFQKIVPQDEIDNLNYADFTKFEYFGEWFSAITEKYEKAICVYPPESIDEVIFKLERAMANYLPSNFSHTSMR